MLEKKNNKKEIIKELKTIYHSVLDKVETKSQNDIENDKQKDFELLNNENTKLKQYIKNIDKKFDYIINENKVLKDYIKSKTEYYENNLHEIISKLHQELKFLNEQNSNIKQNTLKKSNKNSTSQMCKIIEKTSTHDKESHLSNNPYSENILQTEESNSNRNEIIHNEDESKEYDVADSSKIFASLKNGIDSGPQVYYK